MSEFLAPLNYDRAQEALCRLSAYGGYDEQKAEEAMGVLRECYPLVFSKTEQELFPKGSVLLHLQGASVTDPLIFTGHLDVPDGQATPFMPNVPDIPLSVPMSRAHVVALLEALEELLRDGYRPGGDLFLALSMDGLSGAEGARAMADYLQGKTGLPVRLANDANAAALGEALAGCAKGAESAVIVTLGTGVGGGVVLNGKLLTGYTGAASEPGHTVICDTPNAPLCTCGRRGCFEAYASATALIRMTRQTMDAHPESALHTVAANGTVTGRTAFDAAELGDAAAKQVVDDYIHYLAVGIANLTNMFSPQVIGLSGGVANQGENLLRPLRAAVQPMIFGDEYAKKHTTLTTCTLGYRSGVIGAALLNRV